VKGSYIGNESIRGISGGQRRRVTLLRGLVSGANIIFADEPTSGLSSRDAEVAIEKLKLFTLKFGLSAVVVIHQPKAEVARLFDDLILLTSEPGRVVYQGPMKEAHEHYTKVGYPPPPYGNPADFYLDMVSPGFQDEKSSEFYDYYEAHIATRWTTEVEAALATPGKTARQVVETKWANAEQILGAFDMPHTGKYIAPFSRQFAAVFYRQVTLTLRNKQLLITEVFSNIGKGVFIGIAFLGTNEQPAVNQLSFVFLVLQMASIGLLQNMSPQIADRTVMKFDTSDQLYRPECFIMSVFVVNTTKTMLGNTIFCVISFAMSGLSFSEFFGTFYIWFLLLVLAMDSFFSFIAAVARTMEDSMIRAMPFLILFLLFNGFFVTLKTAQDWMVWALYVSPFFWATSQIAVSVFSDGVLPTNPAYPTSGQFVVDTYE